MSITQCVAIVFISLMLPSFSWAANPPEIPQISEFQIQYQDSSKADVDATATQRAMEMSSRIGENFAHVRSGKGGGQILRTNRKLTRAEAWALATRMIQAGGVESAHPVDPDFDVRPPARPPVK